MVDRSQSEKRAIFRELHRSGCFVLPNPWDVGSAAALASLGFRALATTSSGYAWSCGHADGQMTRDDVLAHLRLMARSTDLPINADFESGYAATPDGVAENVSMAIETAWRGYPSRIRRAIRARPCATSPRQRNACRPRGKPLMRRAAKSS